jgi:hypothetical protein
MMTPQEYDEARSSCDREAQRYFGISMSDLLKRVQREREAHERLAKENRELLDELRVIGYSFWTDGEPMEERLEFLQETARAAIARAEES